MELDLGFKSFELQIKLSKRIKERQVQ